MKLVMVRMGNRKGHGRMSGLNLERILAVAVLTVFALLILVQVLFMNPSISAFLSVEPQLEGEPLNQQASLYEEGEIGLELMGINSCTNLKVLVNGDEAASFSSKRVNLKLKEGDVIEIDGSRVKDEEQVVVASVSSNISDELMGTSVKVKSDIRGLLKVEMK